jgi:hypothetical protein
MNLKKITPSNQFSFMKKLYSFLLPLFLLPLFSSAHPMAINFEDMIHQCKLIVIAKFQGAAFEDTKYNLEVESVLLGTENKKNITVGRAHGRPFVRRHEHLSDKRIVAFINKKNEWEWIGVTDSLESLETGMIYLSGFYDYNDYEVDPGGVSMVQLKEFIQSGKFKGTMEGNLEFKDYNSNAKKKSATHFTITYTYYNSDKVVSDITSDQLPLVDFPKKPEIYFYGEGIQLTYEENLIRPLVIWGLVDSVYASGKDFHATFEVDEPENIDSTLFYKYLSNPSLGPLYYEMQIKLNDSTSYPFIYNIESGRFGYMEYENEKIECQKLANPLTEDSGYFEFRRLWNDPNGWNAWDTITIRIEIKKLPDEQRYKDLKGSYDWVLIESLRIAPFNGEFFLITGVNQDKKVSKGKCTISFNRTLFAPNPNYGK